MELTNDKVDWWQTTRLQNKQERKNLYRLQLGVIQSKWTVPLLVLLEFLTPIPGLEQQGTPALGLSCVFLPCTLFSFHLCCWSLSNLRNGCFVFLISVLRLAMLAAIQCKIILWFTRYLVFLMCLMMGTEYLINSIFTSTVWNLDTSYR